MQACMCDLPGAISPLWNIARLQQHHSPVGLEVRVCILGKLFRQLTHKCPTVVSLYHLMLGETPSWPRSHRLGLCPASGFIRRRPVTPLFPAHLPTDEPVSQSLLHRIFVPLHHCMVIPLGCGSLIATRLVERLFTLNTLI